MDFTPLEPKSQPRTLSPGELAIKFESLGDNCEFGLFQRRCGVDPLGLLRLNWTTLDSLLKVLESEFKDIGDPEKMEIWASPGSHEFFVRMPEYGFAYHTGQYDTKISASDVLAQQIKTQNFLKRKLMDDLRSGEKILVRKGSDTATLSDAQKLQDAVRKYGSNTLLWVVQEDDTHRRGLVEVVGNGLLRGYIDRFAPQTGAPDLSPCWLDLCRHAYALALSGCKIGTALQRSGRRETTNLLRRVHLEERLGWSGPWNAPSASFQPSSLAPPRDASASQVIEFRLTEETKPGAAVIMLYKIPNGLVPNAPYVASSFVRIPEDADLTTVGIIIVGVSGIHVERTNLKLRDRWQRIWSHVRLPAGRHHAAIGLFVIGRPGARVYSAGWQLELGQEPTEYVPSDAGGMPPV
jgi:hypothetical protein